jgi:DNA-binding MurR/RpiR family transcriptional regulator
MPTIVRTCRSFGFESVREFMLALAQDLAVTGSYLHRSVLAEDSASDVASKIIHAAVSSLTELGRRIDVDVVDRVATRLAAARRIDCYSVGAASTFMASELQSRLFRLGCTSNAIFDAHQQLVSASTLGPDGVAFVISHVGRMPYTLEAARFARSQGATVVALTQPDTQLAEIADLVLAVSVPQDAVMRVGTEAYLAHLVVIEILMVRLAQKLGPVATHGLQQFKQLLHKHGFDSAEYSGATETIDDEK